MAEVVTAEVIPQVRPERRALRPWLRAGQTPAAWLDSLEEDPPPGEDMLPMNAPHAKSMRHTAEGSARSSLPRPAGGGGVRHAGGLRAALSKSTWKRDVGPKLQAYALIGVRECFLFDPTGVHMAPALRGYSLSAAGARPLADVTLPNGARGVRSEALELFAHAQRAGEAAATAETVLALRWHDPRTGENLRTCAEQNDCREAEKRERRRAEREREHEKRQRQRAERERDELAALVRKLRGD